MTPGPGEHLDLDYGVRIISTNHALLNGNTHFESKSKP